jgi:hypothetical protein
VWLFLLPGVILSAATDDMVIDWLYPHRFAHRTFQSPASHVLKKASISSAEYAKVLKCLQSIRAHDIFMKTISEGFEPNTGSRICWLRRSTVPVHGVLNNLYR